MRTRTSIALAAALALAAPAGAQAAQKMPPMPKGNFGIKTAKFLVSVDTKQVTTWKEPRWKGNFDCQGQRWQEGGGKETVRLRTRKPVKTTITKAGPSAMMVRYAGKKRRELFMSTPGKVTRSGRIVNSIDPDWCFGGGPTSSDTGPYDCRTLKKPNMQANLVWRGSRMSLEVLDQDGIFPEEHYRNCPMIFPHGVEEAGLTTISQRYPPREVFDRSEGLVEVLGRRTFRYKDQFRAATTTVTWKVRLRRMR